MHGWRENEKRPRRKGLPGAYPGCCRALQDLETLFTGLNERASPFPYRPTGRTRHSRCPHHSPVGAPQRRASTTGPENRANSIPRRRTPHSSRRTAWAQLYATATDSFSSCAERCCRSAGGGRHGMSRPPSPRSDCYSKLPCHPRATLPTQPITPRKSPRWSAPGRCRALQTIGPSQRRCHRHRRRDCPKDCRK